MFYNGSKNRLTLCFIPVLSLHDPLYVWREDVFNAVTGSLVCSDMGEMLEKINMEEMILHNTPEIKVLNKPIFSGDHYNCLKLRDEVTHVDPFSPHPFFPILSDEEIRKAKDIAITYLKQHLAGEPYQCAFVRKEEHEPTNSI